MLSTIATANIVETIVVFISIFKIGIEGMVKFDHPSIHAGFGRVYLFKKRIRSVASTVIHHLPSTIRQYP